ncbi:MAG: DUF1501 domain-containing protein [Steroidobacteraceae bacterium]
MDHNRRRFLRAATAGGLAYAFGRAPGSVMAQVASVNTLTDYKALVCLFLFGGNDSWNMVVPRSTAEYNVYKTSRQNLAVDQAALLPINPLTPGAAQYGFHPSMAELQGLFESNRCAVMPNIGPLIAPITKAQYQAGSVPLPPQLFSHNDQQDQWHSLKGRSLSKTGWAGRVADVLASQTAGQQLATNISLAGQTLFQAGSIAVPYTMGATGAQTFTGFGTTGINLARRNAFETLAMTDYSDVYERAFAATQQRAVRYADSVNTAIMSARPTLAPLFETASTNPSLASLSRQLLTVARMIDVRDRLTMTRQIFFISLGGFDTHDDQLDDQPNLYAGISKALKAFHDATVQMGISDRVVAFTQSDFGRTLTSNGDGSDHGWGGIQLAVGDAVKGREFYGSYPLLQIGGINDVSAGRMIPTTSSDQYAATLAKWFGVTDAQLSQVAPSIDNFATKDLGFLI